ncbi:hypothetical protein CYMTET_11242 [Cymbomonas tetramitiformis]|uniref:Inositol-tetrakisphosphate 1-kinase N-terminal domain-containing protein n=1 Tax=Cymbomonas tetramitiformis TaxID=36881 RepID=A0AAE0GN41_9CHLO|nr:hypothetical protein CYMTET_11242 [Cymbomonas tetramitiformis]
MNELSATRMQVVVFDYQVLLDLENVDQTHPGQVSAHTVTLLERLHHHGILCATLISPQDSHEASRLLALIADQQLEPYAPALVAQPQSLLTSLMCSTAFWKVEPPNVALIVKELNGEGQACLAAGFQVRTLGGRDTLSPQGSSIVLRPPLQNLLRLVALSGETPSESLLVAGYAMKKSREFDLACRGLLPLQPRNGICFIPIDCERSLTDQGPFDALLHKVTDTMEVGDKPGAAGILPAIAREMTEYSAKHPGSRCVARASMEGEMHRGGRGPSGAVSETSGNYEALQRKYEVAWTREFSGEGRGVPVIDAIEHLEVCAAYP